MIDYTEEQAAELRASEPYRQFVQLYPAVGPQTDWVALDYADRQLGMTCGRCHQRTGNNSQGHYWAHCKVTGQMEPFHFCCPDDCQLVAIAEGREQPDHEVCGRPQSEHTEGECPPPL